MKKHEKWKYTNPNTGMVERLTITEVKGMFVHYDTNEYTGCMMLKKDLERDGVMTSPAEYNTK